MNAREILNLALPTTAFKKMSTSQMDVKIYKSEPPRFIEADPGTLLVVFLKAQKMMVPSQAFGTSWILRTSIRKCFQLNPRFLE